MNADSKDETIDANSWSGKSDWETNPRRLLASTYTLACSRLIVVIKSDESACDNGSARRFSGNLERACRAAGLMNASIKGDQQGMIATHVSSCTK